MLKGLKPAVGLQVEATKRTVHGGVDEDRQLFVGDLVQVGLELAERQSCPSTAS